MRHSHPQPLTCALALTLTLALTLALLGSSRPSTALADPAPPPTGADPLEGALRQAAARRAALLDAEVGQAAVTFALLSPALIDEAALARAEGAAQAAARAALVAALPELSEGGGKGVKGVKGMTGVKGVKGVKGVGLRPLGLKGAQGGGGGVSALLAPLSVVALPVDSELPINLEALAAGAGARAAEVRGARGVVFVSYRGPALKARAHLNASCAAAEAALGALDGLFLAVPLGTLEPLDAPALRERCAALSAPDLIGTWVRPALDALDGGQLRLTSRGLAQLGRPELELGPLSRAAAAGVFGPFQEALRASQLGPALSVGGVVSAGERRFKLAACERPAHAYDGECVRLVAEP